MGKLNEIQEVEIVYKRPILSSMERVTCSEEAVKVFREIIPKEKIDLKEFFVVALLSRSNSVLGVSLISIGTSNSSVVDIKEIIQLAIKTNSSSIIIGHNHPSGNLKISDSDLKITKKVKEACRLVDVALLDHVILTSESYLSFADEGLI